MSVDFIIEELSEHFPDLFKIHPENIVRSSIIDFIATFNYRSDVLLTKDDSTHLKLIKKLILKHHKFPRKKPKSLIYITPTEKICTKCNDLKSITQFDKLPNGKYKAACAKCVYVHYLRPCTLKRLKKRGRVPKSEKILMTAEERKNKRIADAKLPRNKIARNLRGRLSKAVKKRGGNLHIQIKDIGCTKFELITHIESKFKEGMTWCNYGEWEIDHIRPLASFDLLNSDELKLAANYQNLEPIWKLDNQKKTSYWNGVKYVKGKPLGDR